MTDCFICNGKLKPFKDNLLVCYPCEQAYYIDMDGNLDYYANLGEFIPLTRKHLPIPNFKERYVK